MVRLQTVRKHDIVSRFIYSLSTIMISIIVLFLVHKYLVFNIYLNYLTVFDIMFT